MNAKRFNRCLSLISQDERAFREIYEYYLPKVKCHVLTRYGRQVDFEDVAHDLFTRLIGMKNPPEVANPTAWILRIADNVCLDAIRKSKYSSPFDDNLAAPTEAYGYGTTERVDSNSAFFAILQKLKPDDAELMTLVFWYGYSLKDCAEILGITYPSARQRYSRALKQLREK